MTELERKLGKITHPLVPKGSVNSGIDSLSSFKSFDVLDIVLKFKKPSDPPVYKSNGTEYVHSYTSHSNGQSAKSSASALTSIRPSPPRKPNEELVKLYSKSVSSISKIQPNTKKSDSVDDFIGDSMRKTPIHVATDRTELQLSSGYKYTTFRQSWSNLTQMNQF